MYSTPTLSHSNSSHFWFMRFFHLKGPFLVFFASSALPPRGRLVHYRHGQFVSSDQLSHDWEGDGDVADALADVPPPGRPPATFIVRVILREHGGKKGVSELGWTFFEVELSTDLIWGIMSLLYLRPASASGSTSAYASALLTAIVDGQLTRTPLMATFSWVPGGYHQAVEKRTS